MLLLGCFLLGGFKLYLLCVKGLDFPTAGSESHMWYRKTNAPAVHDVVVAGDSRVQKGISPRDMGEAMDKARVLNFGYSSTGLDAFFLEAAAGKLSDAGRRILVVGVTPHSLTPKAVANRHYRETLRISSLSRYADALSLLLGRETTRYALSILFGREDQIGEGQARAREGGWWECVYPVNPDQGLPVYRRQFATNKVTPQLLEGFLAAVRQLKKRGIEVFAFRPPTYPKMEALENELSGFDEAAFVAAFRKAGGTWIALDDRFGFVCYDGSHILGDDARRLSRELGQKIAAHLAAQ